MQTRARASITHAHHPSLALANPLLWWPRRPKSKHLDRQKFEVCGIDAVWRMPYISEMLDASWKAVRLQSEAEQADMASGSEPSLRIGWRRVPDMLSALGSRLLQHSAFGRVSDGHPRLGSLCRNRQACAAEFDHPGCGR